jgi:hypothetical protein
MVGWNQSLVIARLTGASHMKLLTVDPRFLRDLLTQVAGDPIVHENSAKHSDL